MCCGCFMPSEELSVTLSRYMDEASEAKLDPKITDYAVLSLKRASEIIIKGPRKMPPSDIEIEALKANKPIVIRIYLLDGTTKAIYVNGFTTIRDAVEDLNEKFNLTHADGFSLYEVNHEADTILPLSSANYVCDYLAHWERFLQPNDKGLDTRFKFLYKRRAFLLDPISDIQQLSQFNPFVFNLLFHQVLYDVRNGKIPVTAEESSNLLSIQLQIKYGNYEKEKCPVNKANLINWLPKHLRNSLLNQDDYLHKMIDHQQKLRDISPNDGKLLYLKLVRDSPLYGANVFNVMTKGKANQSPTKAWVVINRTGVSVYDPFTKDSKQTWAYDVIVDFNPSRDTVCLLTGNLMKPEKYFFVGHEANYMAEVFNIYKTYVESQQR